MDTTIDGILGQRVKIEQPAQGYRVAIDTVFLAAATPAMPGDKVLDLGCGVGGAMLCLAARVPDIEAEGIEIQPELVELCKKNIARNRMTNMSVQKNNITQVARLRFDHVIMNPPYHDETTHDVSANPIKRVANAEKAGSLYVWFSSAAQALKDDGMLTLIHRADRLNEIIQIAQKFFPTIEIVPLIAQPGTAPKRVLMRFRKKQGGLTYCSPIVLHKPDGGFTFEAENILRHAKAVEFL